MAKNRSIVITTTLSILSLILFQSHGSAGHIAVIRSIDLIIAAVLTFYFSALYSRAEYKRQFISRNYLNILFTFFFSAVTIFLIIGNIRGGRYPFFYLVFNLIRIIYLFFLAAARIRSVRTAIERFTERPARSIILSFLTIIAVGTILLMMPFSTADGTGLRFIDALFTSTSAVCVTGLIVVDTATAFSIAGKIIILLLIQTGGLGIMMLSYISLFIFRQKLSIDDKQRLSLVISDSDLSGITETLKKIIRFCLVFEAAGAALIFTELSTSGGFSLGNLFSAVFHSVSAFCNAGFSLYSSSLEAFASHPLIILTVSVLIIAGGLSFSVFFNIRNVLNPRERNAKLSLNSKVVLSWTAGLLLCGTVFFYAAEHSGSLLSMKTADQYLAAFFQSVTLRTAGFNTVPFTNLASGTIVIMCIFMFIGAASGSTAGGIKINTAAVITAYMKSLATNSPKITIYNHQLSKSRVLRAFAVLQYGILILLAGTAALAFTQDFELKDILFEAVSAFGTVGLSTGITSGLNSFGKAVIILLMFNGRLGPLTILSIFAGKTNRTGTVYPQGDILIG